jgi:hypothetical protein
VFHKIRATTKKAVKMSVHFRAFLFWGRFIKTNIKTSVDITKKNKGYYSKRSYYKNLVDKLWVLNTSSYKKKV